MRWVVQWFGDVLCRCCEVGPVVGGQEEFSASVERCLSLGGPATGRDRTPRTSLFVYYESS
jgi:hypothetical protein